jgi:hypothetical protein
VTTGGVPAPRLFDGRYGSRRRTRDWNKQQQRLVGPQRTLKFQRRTNEAAGLARPYKHHVDRRRSSFELGRHAGIGPVELRTDRANDRDMVMGNAGGDQALFNRRCAGSITPKSNKSLMHDSPSGVHPVPGCNLSGRSSETVNSNTKNVMRCPPSRRRPVFTRSSGRCRAGSAHKLIDPLAQSAPDDVPGRNKKAAHKAAFFSIISADSKRW